MATWTPLDDCTAAGLPAGWWVACIEGYYGPFRDKASAKRAASAITSEGLCRYPHTVFGRNP